MDGEIQPDFASTSPGAVLAAARAAQGLTIENVGGKLKLTSVQIKAIEADDFNVLPGAVFARGFVRNYARLLNLDAEPLLHAMARCSPQASVQQDGRLLRVATGVALEKTARFRAVPMAVVMVAVVVGVLAYYEFVLNDSHTAQPLPAVSSVTANSAVAANERSAVLLVPPVAEPAPRDDAQGAASAAAIPRRALHFLFSQESWVEVRDGLGNILFSQINRPGTERRVEGDPPFSVTVGRAHGVSLAYNGNAVDLAAHATNDVARLRLE